MKTLICPYSQVLPWCETLFPDCSICGLPVAGKALVMHWIDLFSQLKASEIRILDYEFEQGLLSQLNGGERWNLEVEYVGGGLCLGVRDLLRQNQGFVCSSSVWVVYGPVLPCVTSLEDLSSGLVPVSAEEVSEDGVYLYRDGVLYRSTAPLYRLSSLCQYYDCNQELLRQPRVYVLPGYSSEAGIHLGMNVSIERGCEVRAPVLLGDNVSLGAGCELEDGVILGHDVLVGKDTELRGSIVMEHTYVGNGMELRRKIVKGGRIVDPDSGEYVDYAGFGVVRGMDSSISDVCCNLVEYLLALFLAVSFLIPYVFFRGMEIVWRRTLWGYKWGVDRYPKYFLVLFWRYHLIKRQVEDEWYVFHFSDSFPYYRTPGQRRLDESYYCSIRSVPLILSVVFRCLTYRWFANVLPDA